MRSKFKWIFTLLVAFTMQFCFAQQKTVTGTVTSVGAKLPGATVSIAGKKYGTQTDENGKFSIKANQGDVLEFSFLGKDSKSVTVGASNIINVVLGGDKVIETVVVVGQGVAKDKKKLSYQVSTLSSEQLEGKPQSDVVRSMQGKVSGVQITNTGGLAGQTSNFVFRGNKSFTGNSQPLFVVDGVPFDTSSSDVTGSFNSGAAASSNRFLDLDPANIESISFLKGLSASVTYGSRGRNGVVLITTKGGKKGENMKVSYGSSVYFSEVANLPEFTNRYGNGNNNIIGVGNIGNWGAEFDSNIQAPHPYSAAHLSTIFPEYVGATRAWQAAPNNVKDFFRIGVATQNSLVVSGGTEKVSYAFNGSYTDEDGIVDYNNVTKYNLGAKINAQLNDKFSIKTSFTYFNTKFSTPPVAAANGAGAISIFERLLYMPRDLDLMNLPYANPVTGASVFYRTDTDNPRWLLNNVLNEQNVDRTFLTFEPNYKLSKTLDVTYRFGFDRYVDNQKFHVNKGSTEQSYSTGYLRTVIGTNTLMDQSLLFKRKKINFTDDFGVEPILGFNARHDSYRQSGISSLGQIVFGSTDHSFFSTSSNDDQDSGDLDVPLQYSNLLGAFATLDFNYKTFLYLNVSGRNDWYSSLEGRNRAVFYPAASVAFIPSSAFELFSNSKVDFLKLRAAYGSSAGFPGLYNTRGTFGFSSNIFQSTTPIPGNGTGNLIGNPDLKPELHKELEFGVETEMFNKRVILDASYYSRRSENQIVSRAVDPATSGTSQTINAGRIDNKGIEANLTVIPVRTDNFEWSVTGIFYKNKSKVVELPDGQDKLTIAGFSNGIGNAAVVGEPYGVLFGDYALTDANGNYLINPGDGTLISSTDVGLPNKIIGDPNPEYTLSVNNGLSYKGLNLGFLFEFTKGGDFYSHTIENLLRRGVTKDTEEGREQTYVVPGVFADPTSGAVILDGNGQPIPNNIQISANNVYFLNTIDPNSQNIYDATRLRLREVSLAYSIPKKMLKNTGVDGITFGLVANNLWFKAFNLPKYTNVDPDLISTGQGNGLGLDFQTAPQSKRYGFNIKVNF